MKMVCNWIIISFSGYAVSVSALMLLLRFISSPIPEWVEKISLVFAAPLIILSIPWTPFLRENGLTEGEWIRLPTPLGFLVVGLIYTSLLYVLLKWIVHYWR